MKITEYITQRIHLKAIHHQELSLFGCVEQVEYHNKHMINLT